MSFRDPIKMLTVFVLNHKGQPNKPPILTHGWLVKDNSMPQRDWKQFDAPTAKLSKPRVNVARRKFRKAREEAKCAFLIRQAS